MTGDAPTPGSISRLTMSVISSSVNRPLARRPRMLNSTTPSSYGIIYLMTSKTLHHYYLLNIN